MTTRQQKKKKIKNNDLQNISQKIKNWETRNSQQTEVNTGASEG